MKVLLSLLVKWRNSPEKESRLDIKTGTVKEQEDPDWEPVTKKKKEDFQFTLCY